ncbi:fimbrin-3-like [Impatiens glandulifera]|uniref:fimbrin-3-like n=1 Tax=Impatiens glandulifera TaxID=253017 RepID=UPI001FB07B7C|nr:fimbrin-3-like [Impatiens glandulifera]
MSGFGGVLVSDQLLQSEFTQVELRSLKSKFSWMKAKNGKVTVGDLPALIMRLKSMSETFKKEEVHAILNDHNVDSDLNDFISHL